MQLTSSSNKNNEKTATAATHTIHSHVSGQSVKLDGNTISGLRLLLTRETERQREGKNNCAQVV